MIGDLDSGTLTVVDRSEAGRTDDLAWSPDGAWLAYTFWTDRCATARSSCTTSQARRACSSRSPSSATTRRRSIPTGKYLYFLSLRTFDPVYDSVQFELSFPRAARPYLIALQAGGRAAVRSGAQGPEAGRRRRGERDEGRRSDTDAVRVDLDGIERRVAAFPVPEEPLRADRRRRRRQGRLDACCRSSARTAAAATRRRRAGSRSSISPRCAPRRCSTRPTASRSPPTTPRSSCAKASGCAPSPPTASPKPTRDAAAPSDAPSRKSGWIDLERIRAVGRAAPRVAADAARGLAAAARPVLGRRTCRASTGTPSTRATSRCSTRVSTRAELSDLIWEMQGELGTSHAYEMGGDHRRRRRSRSATWPPTARSPTTATAATRSRASSPATRGTPAPIRRSMRWASRRRSGERIVAVNGQPASRERAAAGAARASGRRPRSS